MKKLVLLFMLIVQFGFSQELKWSTIPLNVKTSIRGMSVVNDSVAWISGSGGYIVRTLNGGAGWTIKQIPGFEKTRISFALCF